MKALPKSYAIKPLTAPFHGVVRMPGSKSYSNRALIMGSLAGGVSTLKNVSAGDDTAALISALRHLGIKIEQTGATVKITGNGGRFAPTSRRGAINVGAAGTTMRFLTALCALVPREIVLDGSERMRERPLGALVEALRSLGADIQYAKAEGFPPLIIKGGVLRGGAISLPGSISSQYITALLLIAPLMDEGLVLNVMGEQISASYIAMTKAGMKSFGVEVLAGPAYVYRVPAGQSYRPTDYNIEGDASGASYFWALAALTGSTITVNNIDPKSAQGDAGFADILGDMGCVVAKDAAGRSITVQGAPVLRAVKVDMSNLPDTAQTLAVVGSAAVNVYDQAEMGNKIAAVKDFIKGLVKRCSV